MGDDDENMATTQLDSHANMIVVGRQATVFGSSGKHADVRPFSNNCSKLEAVPIVDAAIAYDCPYSMKTYLLTVRNALHVESMPHNLIPPFILREAGLRVNEVPRIHTKQEEITDETHCIVARAEDNGLDLRIPLKLDGIFSYFTTRKLTEEEVEACEYIPTLELSPDAKDWDPYDSSFANQEESMIDFRGDAILREPKRRKVLDDRDVCEINVSEEKYEAAISSIVEENHCNPQDGDSPVLECNPQGGEEDFMRDDNVMRAAVADLSP